MQIGEQPSSILPPLSLLRAENFRNYKATAIAERKLALSEAVAQTEERVSTHSASPPRGCEWQLTQMKSEETATARKAEIELIVTESVRCGEFSSTPTIATLLHK